jgi:predicted dithiol-disulfide oxidoreductase (DUF899 family)
VCPVGESNEPLGRQEVREDSSAGYKLYEWWRRHDEYEDD